MCVRVCVWVRVNIVCRCVWAHVRVCVCLLLIATATSPHWGQVAHWLQGSTCERAGPEARRGWQPPPIGGKLSPAPNHGSHWKQTGNSTIFCGNSNIFWEKTGNSTIPAPLRPPVLPLRGCRDGCDGVDGALLGCKSPPLLGGPAVQPVYRRVLVRPTFWNSGCDDQWR